MRRTEEYMEEMKKFRKGEVIFKEVVFQLWMYDLLFGAVALYVDYGTPEEVLVSSTSAPAFFGEVGLMESIPRFATAVALEDCVTKVIRHEDLSEYFRNNPSKVMSMLESLSEKLGTAYRMFGYACQTFEEFVETARSGKSVSDSLKAKALKFAKGAEKIRASRHLGS